ncbi:MAG: preprotein translocase subunit SecG [Clostridia bacterium]|nr:preprotein translocase subunit SecG [Clostridia bacterium]
MFNFLGFIAEIPTTILVFGIVVIVAAVFLIIAVLMQQGKQHNLSGTIAGAADTFFGKTKGSTISKKLSVVTSVVAILFVIMVLAYYIVQTPNEPIGASNDTTAESVADAVSGAADEAADAVSDAADEAADAVSDAADEAEDAVSEAADTNG